MSVTLFLHNGDVEESLVSSSVPHLTERGQIAFELQAIVLSRGLKTVSVLGGQSGR